MHKYHYAPTLSFTSGFLNEVLYEINPDVVFYTEMLAAASITKKSTVYKRLDSYIADQIPTVAQLYGKVPENFVNASVVLKELGFYEINLNMGCPSKSVLSSKHGAYMLYDKEMAYNIVSEIIDKCELPLSIKTRLGWENRDEIFEFVEKMKNIGIKKFIIHGRLVKEFENNEEYILRYNYLDKFPADWKNIYKIKKMHPELEIIGNGDLVSKEDCDNKIKNLDGVMVCRAAMTGLEFFAEKEIDIHKMEYYLKKLVDGVFKHFKYENANKRVKNYLLKFLNRNNFNKDHIKKITAGYSKEDFYELIEFYLNGFYK